VIENFGFGAITFAPFGAQRMLPRGIRRWVANAELILVDFIFVYRNTFATTWIREPFATTWIREPFATTWIREPFATTWIRGPFATIQGENKILLCACHSSQIV